MSRRCFLTDSILYLQQHRGTQVKQKVLGLLLISGSHYVLRGAATGVEALGNKRPSRVNTQASKRGAVGAACMALRPDGLWRPVSSTSFHFNISLNTLILEISLDLRESFKSSPLFS